MDPNRSRALGYQALERFDREQALDPRPERPAPGHHAPGPAHAEGPRERRITWSPDRRASATAGGGS